MLVEFSLVLPGFFVVLLGGLTIADALSAYNRVQNVATTVGTMSSRLKIVLNEDVVGISSAAKGFLFPFPQEGLSILIAAVWVDGTGTPDVQWCERWGPAKPTGESCSGKEVVGNDEAGYWVTSPDAEVTIDELTEIKIPSGILNPNTGIIVAYASYDWVAPYLSLFPGQLTEFTMKETFFAAPRADVSLTPPKRDRETETTIPSYKVSG